MIIKYTLFDILGYQDSFLDFNTKCKILVTIDFSLHQKKRVDGHIKYIH